MQLPYSVITIFPLSGCWVDDAEQLVIGHGFWVKVRPHRFAFHVLIGPLQWPHHLTLSSACIPDNKNRVTDGQQLLQLHNLTQENRNETLYLCFVSVARRVLLTRCTYEQWPFNRSTVNSLAFHGPVHTYTLMKKIMTALYIKDRYVQPHNCKSIQIPVL